MTTQPKTFRDGSPIPIVLMWEGEPIDNLDKPQIIEIIRYLAEQADAAREREYQHLQNLFPRPPWTTSGAQ